MFSEEALASLVAPLSIWESFYVIVGSSVVHFCMALFIAAVLSAPWETLHGPGIALTVSREQFSR